MNTPEHWPGGNRLLPGIFGQGEHTMGRSRVIRLKAESITLRKIDNGLIVGRVVNDAVRETFLPNTLALTHWLDRYFNLDTAETGA